MSVEAARRISPPFRQSTRQKIVRISPSALQTSAGVFGGPDVPIVLPSSGYLGMLYLQIAGTLTTAAGTAAGNLNGYPYLPFSLAKKIVLENNLGGDLINVSGFGLALLNLCRKNKQTLENPNLGQWNTTNQAGVWNAPSRTAAVAASTGYNLAASWEIPIPTDDALELGLLLAQSNTLQTKLTITPATQADIQGSVTGVVPFTSALNAYGAAEVFDVPNDSGSQPDRQWLHNIFENIDTTIAGNGEYIYRLPPGPVYLRVIGMVEAGGVPVSRGTITKLEFRYGQSNTVYSETYDEHLIRMFYKYGIVLPDGMFVYDYTLGYGIPGIVEPRDFMDTSQFTDLQIAVTVGTLGANPQVRWIREYLAEDANYRPQR